jgi:acetyl esterase/lipase
MSVGKIILTLLGAVVLAGVLVACAPVAALNALAPGHTHTRTAGVAYGPGPRQQLDVYQPARAAPRDGWPVVVFFYGGSWNRGKRSEYAFVGEALASRGILTLVADYRLYPEVRYPDFLRDSAAALAWGLSQARRLQRRHAGAGPALAEAHRSFAARAGRLHWPGGAV